MARKLRIAVSMFFGALTVALFLLWVRSFETSDHLRWRVTDSRAVSLSSREGILGVVTWTNGLDGVTSLVDSRPVIGSPPRRKMSNRLEFEFLRSQEHGSVGIVVPYLFTVLTCAICVIVPQVVKSLRFNLRTLLIVTTLLGMMLGFAMWMVR